MEQENNSGWGGARPNSGRKKELAPRKQYGMRLTVEEYHVVCAALYGLRWKESKAHRPAEDLLEFAMDQAHNKYGKVYRDMMARKSPTIEHQLKNPEAYVVGAPHKDRALKHAAKIKKTKERMKKLTEEK